MGHSPDAMTAVDFETLGVVVIGRNEGERLRSCLRAVRAQSTGCVVYVDSGSTDGSVSLAHSMGVAVVELDMRIPFTAARARNAGFRRLRHTRPSIDYVQFVDGDCELVPGWSERGLRFLAANAGVAAVAGRLRERHSSRSIYNLLCDIEWDVPSGDARAIGGIALVRANAFEAVNGFRDDLIAGEEPELCVRLRAAGWRVWRLDDEMALHDAAMLTFWQWWARTRRTGFAYAEGAYLHGALSERHCVGESRSAWFWGAIVPLTAICGAIVLGLPGLACLLLYPVQLARLASRGRRSTRENYWRAFFLVLGKFPEVTGQLSFFLRRLRDSRPRLIEYK